MQNCINLQKTDSPWLFNFTHSSSAGWTVENSEGIISAEIYTQKTLMLVD